MVTAFAMAVALMSPPAFVEVPCADQQLAQTARCGTVAVPENRASSTGRLVRLNVIVLPAVGERNGQPPLFDIEGGPGLPATKNASFYIKEGGAYRAGRDVVLVDQRGTGGSNGLLCPELSRPEAAFQPMLPAGAVSACRARLERTADLAQYGTADAVADLDVVRRALNHGQIDIFAVSYGTTVALRYMSTHLGRVRAAVLMGTAPPDATPPKFHASAGQRALDLLFADCAADVACRTAFLSPASDLRKAMDALRSSGEMLPEVFAEKIRSLLYAPSSARRVPYIVNRAAAGDLKPFHAATRSEQRLPYADGMFLSVTCSEGVALINHTRARAVASRTVFGDYRLQRQRAACVHWRVRRAPADHLTPVASTAAVLLISGHLDPVTPPDWAEATSKRLPNSRHVVLRYGAHILDGLQGVDTCFDPLVLRFFATADPQGLDASCAQQMAPPPFQVAG
jgi:pimeloyl-ACP methyl ester carboxylesterase